MTIWKYPLDLPDIQTLMIPAPARLLSVQTQGGKPCLWALVNPDLPKIRRNIATFGTGQVFDSTPLMYVGTYQTEGGYVFHVFEVMP